MNNQESVKKGNALFFAIIVNYLFINIGLEVLVYEFHLSFTYIQTLLIAQFGYAFPAIVYVIYKKERLRDVIRLRKINLLTIILLMIFTFSVMPLVNLVSVLSLLVGENVIGSTVSGMLDQTSFVFCWLAVGILPAVMEEFVYRGVIYNNQRKGNARKAILCSGLFFGLLHMNINQFSYAFVMGIILALAVEATDTILGSVVIHATLNSYSVGIAKLQPYLAEKMKEMGQETEIADTALSRSDIIAILPTYFKAAIFGTAFAVFIYILIVKYNRREDHIREIFGMQPKVEPYYVEPVNQEMQKKVRFADVWFILSVTICITLMFLTEIS